MCSARHRPKIANSELRSKTLNRKSDVTATSSSFTTSQSAPQLPNGIGMLEVSEEDRTFSMSFRCISVYVLQDLKCKSKHLQHIRLHGNGLLFLPNVLYHILGLKELDVSWNRLSSLNASIGNLTSLERLDISFNALVYIPSEIRKCTSLTCLNVSDNKIKRIPAALRSCLKLQELHFEYNMLTAVPKFLLLSSLRVLTYQGNPCSYDCMHDYIETKHINGFSNLDSQESDLECARRLLADFNPDLLVLFDQQSGF
jgi:Leucine-rich repeat (LRR) protein